MICYVLAMGKQHLGPHVVVGYGIKIFLAGPFHYITRSPGKGTAKAPFVDLLMLNPLKGTKTGFLIP